MITTIFKTVYLILYWLALYYRALLYYTIQNGTFPDCPVLRDDVHARIHVYSIALVFKLWDYPHYRNGTFHYDLMKNLRNVAVPGTCFPLSWLCRYRWSTALAVVVYYPMVVLMAALRTARKDVVRYFRAQLLNPTDWFCYWRLNCALASLHSLKSRDKGYELENKWTFLVQADEANIPVSPWLKTSELVVKDKNEEGGMGLHFFRNASEGGQWIIQERLFNSPLIADMLPETAPLSTFRIMTSSRGGFSETTTPDKHQNCKIQALSCVFRAGLATASTDHESILFDVDMATGIIKKGSTTNHWYRIGVQHIWTTPWTVGHDIEVHPDTQKRICDRHVSRIEDLVQLVEDSHRRLLPGVPMVGWDVAVTTKGILLLEVNLSCNFFRGSFDQRSYLTMVADYFTYLETLPWPTLKSP